MDLLGLIPSELQGWVSNLKGTRDIGEGIELCGIRVRAGGTAFCETKVLAEATVPFLRLPHPTQSQQVGTITKSPSTWLTLFAPPW